MKELVGQKIRSANFSPISLYLANHSSRFARVLWLGVGVWLLAGCVLLPSDEPATVVNDAYAHVLPAGWVAMRDWQAVNLDGDEEEENLLLYTFDSGQVGALIVEGEPTTSIATPDRLLPRNFEEAFTSELGNGFDNEFDSQLDKTSGLGQGVIAAPGTPTHAITVTQVVGSDPVRELLVQGGATHLTFVWWRGANLGYGVTQLYAGGGFGVNWATWQQDPTPLTTIVAYFPLDDYRARANLCRVELFTRRTDLSSDAPLIRFRAEPQGLHFCHSAIPAHPFSPEGVVMAYLHWPRTGEAGTGDSGMINLLTPGTMLVQLDAESAAERWPMEYVRDIEAYQSVPMDLRVVNRSANNPGDNMSGDNTSGNNAASSNSANSGVAPTTTVCVEFAERANADLRRWVVYTLRLQPVDALQRLPERWTVSGAFTEPTPMELPEDGYCAEILNRNAP